MALVGSLSGSLGIVAVTGSFEPGVDNLYSIGTTGKKWNTVVASALSGSLTKLADGSSYIIAGSNISVTTGSNGAITISTVGVGTGDVTGPGSSTDNAVARFDLTTGKIIQNSAVTISDESANVVSIAGSATATTINLFNTDATTVNLAQAATIITAGASGGSTTFQGNLTGSNFLANGSLTVVQGASIGGGFGSTGTTITGAGNISTNGTLLVEGATTLSGSVILGDATGDDLTFNGYAASSLTPKTTNSFDLGTPDLRWRNMYTGDLHLKNERGDWTVIEEEDFLTLTNNKSGKRYKFVLEEI